MDLSTTYLGLKLKNPIVPSASPMSRTVGGIKAMEEDLLTERRSMERIWKKRETQLKRMQLNTSRMFGELQGVMQGSLPDIKTLSLDSGE